MKPSSFRTMVTENLLSGGVSMRVAAIATLVCLSIIGAAEAGDVRAAIREPTTIAPQALGSALQELARDRDFQLICNADLVWGLKTPGISGLFTPGEALTTLLSGTGLTYHYLDRKTVTVVPLAPQSHGAGSIRPPSGSSSVSNTGTKEGKKSSSRNFRLAQSNPEQTAGSTAVGTASGSTSTFGAALQEVVVTAQKRAQTVDSVPLAVTALDMSKLRAAGVSAVRELTSAAPNVQIHAIGVDGYLGITIRGISNLDYTPLGNPAVSTYIDGVYVTQPTGFADEIYDLERVEVLRGPQGTLYGRNATGGNLNIVTADPKQTFGAYADLSYGNYNDVRADAMLNAPISDTLAVRAAMSIHRSDGYFDTENTTPRNYGAADDVAVRLTSLWIPVDAFRWRLSFDGFVSNGTPGAAIETGANQQPLDGLSPYRQPTSGDPIPDNYVQSGAIRSRMDWRATDHLTVSYIAGDQHIRQSYQWATAGQLAPLDEPGFKQYDGDTDSSQSHEVNLVLDTQRLKNVLGANYLREVIVQNLYAVDPIYGIASEPYNIDGDKTSWGVFDQATLSLSQALRFTAGGRYSHDKQQQDSISAIICSAAPGMTLAEAASLTQGAAGCFPPTAYPAASGRWSKVSWKVGLDYDISESTLVYASVTTGYKQGGVPIGIVPPGLPPTYKPETITSYEAGTKARLLDRALSLRFAGFYEDYSNLQITQLVTTPSGAGAIYTTNAGKSGIYGAEVETEWKATRSDYVSAFFTYLHARYDEYGDAIDSRTNDVIPSLAGNQLPNAPELSVRVEYRHDFVLGNGGKIVPLGAVYWQSTSYSQPINDTYYKVGGYSRSSFRLAYTDPTARWQVEAFVDNIENHAVRDSDFSAANVVFSDFGAPRTYGVRLSYRY